MTEETPDLKALAARLEWMAQRLANLEVQVRALVTSQILEAREFVVQDERGGIRARLKMEGHAPPSPLDSLTGTREATKQPTPAAAGGAP